VKRVADWGTLYALRSASGWALAQDDAGNQIFPVWPHERFAALCADGDWSDAVTVEVPLDEWFEEISKTLAAKSMKVAVFRLPEGRGVVVDPERLSKDLREELSLMEDEEE